MKLKLKVCGMRETENIQEISALCPDFMGFIFYDRSPRFVGNNFVIPSLHKSILKVGVFVNEKIDIVLDKIRMYKLDLAQLHGDETEAYCEKIKEGGTGVIKVFSVDRNFDFKETTKYHDVVDYFMFDTKGKNRGGNSYSFDWSLLQKYDQRTAFFLSGGISFENMDGVSDLDGLNIFAVDVNSGVELRPGLKDAVLVQAIKKELLKI